MHNYFFEITEKDLKLLEKKSKQSNEDLEFKSKYVTPNSEDFNLLKEALKKQLKR